MASPSPRKYSSVVFAAYVVPTIPALDGAVGDPDGAGFVSGRYVGLEGCDPAEDIAARFRLVEAAAEQAYLRSSNTRDDEAVLRVFVVPEFFFRGPDGAYPSPDHGYLKVLIGLVRGLADRPRFAHWLFVCGTILESDSPSTGPEVQERAALREDLTSAIVRNYKRAKDDETRDFVFDLLTRTTDFAQAHPLYTVRNRCYVYKQNCADYPDGLCVDKRFVSHEDFVVSLYAPSVYSEASTAYPNVNEDYGEEKKAAFDCRCIFRLDGITFAVEICLDHRRGRLRQVCAEHPPSTPIDVHLVPSCGMQLQRPSIVARGDGGLVFNADGQYAKRDSKACPTEEDSIFTGSADGKGHTQFCRVVTGAKGDDHCTVERPSGVGVTIFPLDPPKGIDVDQMEAYGAGEVHIYSKVSLP